MFNWLKSFRDDESGNMAIELVLVVPILTWVLLSTFVYFDVFRAEASTKRAALTVADMISREQNALDLNFLQGARTLLQTLTFADAEPDVRVTFYTFNRNLPDEYEVVWSRNIDMGPNLTNANLASLNAAGRLPSLGDNGRAFLVETRTNYSAPFSIGIGPFTGGPDLGDLTFDTFTIMQPRFVTQICWDQADPTPDIC